mgnify:CR=1 FL=1
MSNKKKPNQSPFISARELGIDTSKFKINVKDLYDELYESYCACCSMPDADKAPFSEHNFGNEKDLEIHDMAVEGRAGQYRWYALTNLYDESVHALNEFKKRHNRHHIEAACNPLVSPTKNLIHAINNKYEIYSYFKNPIVVNTTIFLKNFDSNAYEFENYLKHSFRQNVFEDVFYNEEDKIKIYKEKIKDKDVIIPQVLATRHTLNQLVKIAKFVCQNGAKTATGIFLTRLKPTSDGVEPKQITSKYRIQPLGPSFSLDFLSGLL